MLFILRAASISMMLIAQTIAKLSQAGRQLALPWCVFEVALVQNQLASLSPAELGLVESWATHRQQEFATGRLCARRALEVLELTPADLLPDRDGVPTWPAGVAGSISHSRGVAMAVVARSENCEILGLDIEKTNRLSETAIRKVVHPLEESFVTGDQLKASVVFSLKEAFYKAQFPRWRTTGNFHDLVLAVDLKAGTARVEEMDQRFASELAELRFEFRLVDEYVVSLCWG
ncbi:MAG: enterobactin synthetase component D [Candidatus Azotimanducaceae bacterium]